MRQFCGRNGPGSTSISSPVQLGASMRTSSSIMVRSWPSATYCSPMAPERRAIGSEAEDARPTRDEIHVHHRPMNRLILALLVLSAMVSLAGCAAMQKGSYDPDKPTRICPSTSEGGESKTFCY